jgi:hypothetical protein
MQRPEMPDAFPLQGPKGCVTARGDTQRGKSQRRALPAAVFFSLLWAVYWTVFLLY